MKSLAYILIAVVIIAGAWFFLANKADAPTTEDTATTETDNRSEVTGDTTGSTVSGDTSVSVDVGLQGTVVTGVKEFKVTSSNFSYDVKEMKVKKGDKVKVVFTNAGGTHDWVLDEFAGAKTAKLGAGQSQTVEFVADKTGTFEYYCSVGTHRQMGMVGKLIVE